MKHPASDPTKLESWSRSSEEIRAGHPYLYGIGDLDYGRLTVARKTVERIVWGQIGLPSFGTAPVQLRFSIGTTEREKNQYAAP
jgi:hypothetical protein